ncbi:MAG TPA: peptidase M23, partial [Rhodospirillaceae bacterium]|nr:peptidase M23 [Rhodospirillaceae bacterium]
MTFLLRIFLAAAALVAAGAYPAGALEISGTFIQGGLATGKVEPGTKLTLDGQPVAVAPNGSFIIGFGRKAKAKMVLRAEPPEGQLEERELAIEKRKYKIQRIDGLPQRKVS